MDRAGDSALMSPQEFAREGTASFRGHRTHFWIAGKTRSRWPLLCVHGGPGMAHDYLRPLEELATTGGQVVFYDQLGCGRSTRLDDAGGWSLELFLEELEAVRSAAGLARCHVLGHGWGGMLALEYALRAPAGLGGLVLSSAIASVPQWRTETSRLVAGLAPGVEATLRAHSRAATLSDVAYRGAVDAFLRRHLCRLRSWPACLERSLANARAHPQAHDALFGPGELGPGGSLETWDITSRLGEIRCPTLVVSGRHDLTPPTLAAALYRGIPDSEWIIFEHSSNMPHLEEPQHYLEVLDGFLGKLESRAQARHAASLSAPGFNPPQG
jgi:L-proline amide hydrolase